MAETMTDPRALFEHELGDILYAEKTIETMLPKLMRETSDARLETALKEHLADTRKQIERLQEVFRAIGAPAKAEKCPGMDGLKQEHDEFLQEQPSQDVLDMFLTGSTARVEHYEIAAYTGLVAAAQGLGEKKAAALLRESLQEERAMLRRAERAGKRLAGAGSSSSKGGGTKAARSR